MNGFVIACLVHGDPDAGFAVTVPASDVYIATTVVGDMLCAFCDGHVVNAMVDRLEAAAIIAHGATAINGETFRLLTSLASPYDIGLADVALTEVDDYGALLDQLTRQGGRHLARNSGSARAGHVVRCMAGVRAKIRAVRGAD